MKSIHIALLLFILTGSCLRGEEISLREQAAIDLCSYPSLGEGVLDILYLAVDEFWHSGDYNRVFPALRLITTISPGEVSAWALGGWFLINGIAPSLESDNKDRVIRYAIEFMEEGIRRNPGDNGLYMDMAFYYYRAGDYEKALSYLENEGKFADNFNTLDLRAHIYEKLGMKKEAIGEWEKIREIFPDMKDLAERFIREMGEE